MFELHNPVLEEPEMALPSIKRAQISQIEPHEITGTWRVAVLS